MPQWADLPRHTPSDIVKGSLFEAGNPSRRFVSLPLGTAVVGSYREAQVSLDRYCTIRVDAAYNYDSQRAGLAWSIGESDVHTKIESGVLGPNHAEMLAGKVGLMHASFHGGRYRRFVLKTDNMCLANIVIGRWHPQKDYIVRTSYALRHWRVRLGGLAVAHVRTREIRALDRASKVALRASLPQHEDLPT